MNDHVIVMYETPDDYRIGVYCSCVKGKLLADFEIATLDELNRIAHEHIEAADRAPLIR